VSKLSKSPLRVAQEALRTGQRTLPCYAHRFSPHRYTQPQLFTCLVLKTFFKTDYRGIVGILRDMPELCALLALKAVPHFTTLQKASQRLLTVPRVDRLLRQTVGRFYRHQRRRRVARVAFDSTGLDLGHRSSYFVRRRNGAQKRWQIVAYSRFAKLEAAIDCRTHLLVAVLASRGPHPDVNRFRPLLQATLANVEPERVLADAGYDSEPNHSFAREGCGVRSFMPAMHGRPSSKPPTGYHRRRMKQRLNRHYGGYGQRWQIETGFSMVKRRISTVVHARSYWSQCRELLLIALTYNLMLLYAAARFLQSSPDTFFLFPLVLMEKESTSKPAGVLFWTDTPMPSRQVYDGESYESGLAPDSPNGGKTPGCTIAR
jgi:DDE family transposase